VIATVVVIGLGLDTGFLTRISVAGTTTLEQGLLDRFHPAAGRITRTLPADHFDRLSSDANARHHVAQLAHVELSRSLRQPERRVRTPDQGEVIKLEAEGLQRAEIARRTGIGVASVYRVLADAHGVAADRMVAA
jgi:Helix-turn-helix domain of resolvase